MAAETLLEHMEIGYSYKKKNFYVSNKNGTDEELQFDAVFFEEFIRSTPNILYVHDLNAGKYFFPNDRLAETLGYEMKELNPMSKQILSGLMHPDDFEKYDDFISRILRSKIKNSFESEFRLKMKNGNWRWFLSRESVLQRGKENNVSKIFGVVTDITNLKTAEAKIRESRDTLNVIIESTSDIIWSVDRDLRLITTNAQFRKVFKNRCGIEASKGMHVLEYSDDGMKEKWTEIYSRALKGERIILDYTSLLNGSRFYSEVTINPVFNSEGIVTVLTTFAKDVTKQRENEQIITKQNNLFSSIIESTNSSIFALDKEYRYIAFNSNHKKTIREIFNEDIEIGKTGVDVLKGSIFYEKTIGYLERALKGESFLVHEQYGRTELKRPYFELHFSPIHDENNEVTGISIFSKDITEKIKSQEQLFYAEKKFREIFEHSPDAIFVEDGSGNLLDFNQAASSIQGLPKEKMHGRNIRDLVPREKYVKILCDYKRLYLGAIKTLESSVWSATNGEIPVEITGKKIRYDYKDAFLLHVRDIRERKKMEAERAQIAAEKSRQKEELIRTSLRIQEEERNRIAAEMHDEIGGGLSKISILSQIIKKSFNDPSTVSASVDKILDASQEVQKNISEIIWAMDPKNDTLENLIAYVNYYTSELLETGCINLTMTFPEKIPSLTLSGKIRRNIFLIVKESLTNIVKHALATHVSFEIQFEDRLLSLVIADNGKGFDMERVVRFKNGIINMKRRIVEVNGEFNIVSEPSKGTTVQLRVPIPVS